MTVCPLLQNIFNLTSVTLVWPVHVGVMTVCRLQCKHFHLLETPLLLFWLQKFSHTSGHNCWLLLAVTNPVKITILVTGIFM